MSTSKPEAGQWWRTATGSRVRVIGQRNGVMEWVVESSTAIWTEPLSTFSRWTLIAEPEQQPQPAEDPYEWVIQDRVPARERDEFRWVGDVTPDQWWLVGRFPDALGLCHGYVDDRLAIRLEVRCRRRDLPKVEQVERWPKYYQTLTYMTPDAESAYVERVSRSQYHVIYKDGTKSTLSYPWIPEDDSRREFTEAEAMALLNKPEQCIQSFDCANGDHSDACPMATRKKPEPQPQKTRVRLWMRNEPKGRPSLFACDERPYPDSHKYIEIHHDAEGFYVEG